MKIQFLGSSQAGLRWMMQYYRDNPQLDRKRALQSFEVTKRRICELVPPKESYEDFKDVWEVSIQRTAFSFLYTIRGDTAYIIDVRDQRGYRSAEALRSFNRELRKKYGD
jgi:hypothetical protein